MKLEEYLERIGYRGDRRPTSAVLAAVQKAHAFAVPFENLDVQLGRPLTTSVEDAFAKIVEGNRGGWCYEQNGLLGWALSELGFDVVRTSASVMRMEPGRDATDSHLCLLVRSPDDVAKSYLVDVGFGGSLLQPLLLGTATLDQPPYTVGTRLLDDGYWQFWENDGSGDFSFDFLARDGDEEAMSRRCRFLQRDPCSPFVQNLVVQQRAGNKHTAVRGRVLKAMSPDGVNERLLESAAELVAVLKQEFRLEVPEIATVWPRIVSRHEELFPGGAPE